MSEAELPTLRTERLLLRPQVETDLERLTEIVCALGVLEWWGDVSDRAKLLRDIACDDEDDSGALTIGRAGRSPGDRARPCAWSPRRAKS